MAEVSLVKLHSDECHWTLPMMSQHWFRYWLGAVRQQAITRANVDPDLCRHMTSLSHNELTEIHMSYLTMTIMVASLALRQMFGHTITWGGVSKPTSTIALFSRTNKMPVRYNLSRVWVRLSMFSQLHIIQYVRLCVCSLPISFVMIERIYILCLIIIIKSEVWTITHCLGLGQ